MTSKINEQCITCRSMPHLGLSLLLQAHEYAQELDRDEWDFAVELRDLKKAGISSGDIRWMICKGFAIHAREITSASDSVRSFQQQAHLAVRKRSCFILTDAGVDFVKKVVIHGANENDESTPCSLLSLLGRTNWHGGSGEQAGLNHLKASPNQQQVSLRPDRTSDNKSKKPKWDCARQELRLGTHVVKEFKLHSPNQAIILGTFEEENWPARIDDPLPPHLEIQPKQRLHDTIKSLNRNQKCGLIRFRGDGTGQGVRWELRSLSSSKQLPADLTSAS